MLVLQNPVDHALLRSYDGTAFVTRIGPGPSHVWGNSSIPCMHLVPSRSKQPHTGSVIFFVGSLEELEEEVARELRTPPREAAAPGRD